MALSNTAIINAKPKDKNYRLYDEKGLYLEVTKAGGRLWRLKYRLGGKEKRFAIGSYPEKGLKAAREARDQARTQLSNGVDPSAHKQAQRAFESLSTGNTFEALAREWHTGKSRVWGTVHAKNVLDRLERNVFPYVGGQALPDITVPELRATHRLDQSDPCSLAWFSPKLVCGDASPWLERSAISSPRPICGRYRIPLAT